MKTNTSNNTRSSADTPVHTIAMGSVVMRIQRGCTQDGYTFLYYQPGRQTPRSAFSNRFFDRDEKDCIKAIQEAVAWIRKNPQAADEGWQEAA